MRSRTYYILGTDPCLLQNVVVQDAWHNTYHYLVLCCLCNTAPTAHSRYLGKCTCFPIKISTTPDGINRLFSDLWEAISDPPWWERLRQAWISLEIWCLINARIVARRTRAQRNSRGLSRLIKASLQE